MSLRKCAQCVKSCILNIKSLFWILDIESYFTLTNSEINGNDNLYSSNVESFVNDVKLKTKDKFDDKLLFYSIISSDDISNTIPFAN